VARPASTRAAAGYLAASARHPGKMVPELARRITLLFSVDQYLAAAGAYQRGLERRREAGMDLVVGSVASLFVSRWDHSTLDQLSDDLKDELGIAVAKRANRAYRGIVASRHWQGLAAAGVRPQRLLFASTGTKDPAKPDTYDVEALAALETVNTMPQSTLDAFVHHGHVGDLLPEDARGADEVIAQVEALGIDVADLAGRLQPEGEDAFVKSWSDLMASIESRTRAVAGARR
jgi:transaldolase